MKKLVVLLLASLLATSAFAVIDPDPDMMGIYFDLNADSNCYTVGASVPFYGYLILTNPTGNAIEGYEFNLNVAVPTGFEAMFFKLAEFMAPSGLNVADPATALGGDYAVGMGTPMVPAEATLLHTWQWMLLSPMAVDLFIRGADATSLPGTELPVIGIYNADQTSSLVNVGTSTGGITIPVATINKDCVVAVEEASFGSVKSLFR